jgi:hypothetical protein
MKLKVFPKFDCKKITFSSQDEVHQLVKEMHDNITNNLPLDHNKGILSKFHISLIDDNVITSGRVGYFTDDAITEISRRRNITPSRKPSLHEAKELLRWMLDERFTTESDDLELEEGFGESGGEEQLKFVSEDEATELASKLYNDIRKRIMLDHRSEILSKFHRSLIAQEIIDPLRKKLHPSILRRPQLSSGKELLLWMLAKKLTREQYENGIKLAEGFGEVEWPQITDDKVKNYLNHLTLAVSQPDVYRLEDNIRRSIEVMVPLSQKSVTDIYKELEDKMKHWYKNNKGKWLHREKFLKWVKEASGHEHIDLINPLNMTERRERRNSSVQNSSGTEPTKWEHLNEVARKYLLEKRVNFFGASIGLNQLFDQGCKDLNELGNLKESPLIRNEEIQVGKQPSEQHEDSHVDWYVDRTIEIQASESVFNNNSQNVETSNEMEIDQDWKTSNQSSTENHEETEMLGVSEPVLYEENELLEEVDGIAIISGVAGMGKSTLLKSFRHKLKVGNPTKCVL